MTDNLFKQEGYDLMGAAFEVHNEFGPWPAGGDLSTEP